MRRDSNINDVSSNLSSWLVVFYAAGPSLYSNSADLSSITFSSVLPIVLMINDHSPLGVPQAVCFISPLVALVAPVFFRNLSSGSTRDCSSSIMQLLIVVEVLISESPAQKF